MPPAAESLRAVRRVDRLDGGEVDALQQAFVVDVRVEELGAVRLERLDGLGRRDGQRLPPAVDGQPAASNVDRDDDVLAADGVADLRGERQVRAAVLEERRAQDDLARARLNHVLRAFGRADAAADAAGQLAGHTPHQVVVVAGAHRGVEVDELNQWEVLEAPHPPEDVRCLDGHLVPLDELDHLSAFEVDAGNEHVHGVGRSAR